MLRVKYQQHKVFTAGISKQKTQNLPILDTWANRKKKECMSRVMSFWQIQQEDMLINVSGHPVL